MLEVNEVHFMYPVNREVKVLEDLNLTFAAGERWIVLGPSGCGKTTLLLLLSGLIVPTSGTVLFDNKRIDRPQKGISLILQNLGLFPWKTVLENTLLGLTLNIKPQPKDKAKAKEILKFFGIDHLSDKYPSQLSGGQKQRVALARALAAETEYVLLDEPFSALDEITRERFQSYLLTLQKRMGFTYILVTHNIEEAIFLGSKIAVLSSQPAHLKAVLNNPVPLFFDRNSPIFYQQCSLLRSLLAKEDSINA